MRIQFALFTALLLTAASYPPEAQAQFSSGSGGSGMFGNRSLGGSLSPGTRTFSSGLGFGAGGDFQGRNSTGGSSGMGQLGTSDRFVRGSRQPGQFVGADTQDLSQVFGGLVSGQNGAQNSRSGLGSQQKSNRANNANQPSGGRAQRGPQDVRASLNIGFNYPRPKASELSSTLAARLEKSQRLQVRSPIAVSIQDGTATLKGVVATEYDRVLAARLVLLEGGIWGVKNELTVARPQP